jgi:TatD DNase family protein
MRWADSHCHAQSMERPDDVMARARAAGVDLVVCVGTDVASSTAACALAGRHHGVLATAGLHPHEASRFETEITGLESIAASESVVAIGESGFDFHYRHSSPEAQESAFRLQIAMAKRYGLALVIHTREAWDETFRVLEAEGVPERTVFHCFTGGVDEACRAVALGAYVSFSGILTFPNADDVRFAAAITPLDRILVETDAPYLTPVPLRGQPNEPKNVAHVGRALASLLDRPEPEIAERVHANTERVFSRG